MKLVVDTNRLLAALIKDGPTRHILHSDKCMFLVPEWAIEEVKAKVALLSEKTGMSTEAITLFLDLLLYQMEIIPKVTLEPFLKEAETMMKEIDTTDTAFIACALATKADGIFTEDKHFDEQNKIRIFKTKELLTLL